MNVELINITENADELIEKAARVCYASECKEETRSDFLHNLIKLGHETPIEHASATFLIDGISRTCSHQLVRHRLLSVNQLSQRYTELDKLSDAWFVCPDFAYIQDEEIKRLIICEYYNYMDRT